jgi:hypothetical protein
MQNGLGNKKVTQKQCNIQRIRLGLTANFYVPTTHEFKMAKMSCLICYLNFLLTE